MQEKSTTWLDKGENIALSILLSIIYQDFSALTRV
jgi:hypothetical protein